MLRVMVFSPHPDDDIIGCGGSMARHISQGNEVATVYMTSGEAGSRTYSKSELARIREKEATRAAEILGVNDVIFLRAPDGYLEYNRDNMVALVSIIRDKQPNLVYVPHQNDLHQDHIVTHKLALEACKRASGPWFQECRAEPWGVNTILAYEVWTPLQELSYIEDISESMELKIQALQQHQSQLQDIQYDEAVWGLNRYRGVMTGRGKYCECFQVIRTEGI